MAFQTFDQAVEYMNSFMNLERHTDRYSSKTYRLDRVRKLLDLLGNPQESYSIIHVAGSKGKGSTAGLIANAINALGYRTGLYMSPHVSDYRERFTLCGKFIEDRILIDTANRLQETVADVIEPTTFELYTAYAFMLFKACGCEWAVIETGLGGRLDATNVVDPVACVFTPIELEHTKVLGDTIEKIAVEKSKITKPRVPVFSSMQDEKALEVLRDEARFCASPFFSLKEELVRKESRCSEDGEYADLEYRDGFKAQLRLRMKGEAQADNAALALLVLRKLNLYKEEVTLKALENTALPGRLEEIVYRKRRFFIDGAHTQRSIGLLAKSWLQMNNGRSTLCIFGCVEGKKDREMLARLLEVFSTLVIARPGTFKKSNPENLYETARELSDGNNAIKVVLREDAEEAVNYAVENTEEGDSILICGSFYLAGDIKEVLCH